MNNRLLAVLKKSQQKQARESLAAAEQQFRLIVEAMPNAIVVVDQAGEILLVNAQGEELFGYDREELIGRPVDLLVPVRSRHDHAGYRADFTADLHAKKMGKGRSLHALRKDGEEVPVEIGLSPIQHEEGLLILASVVDITERKHLLAQEKAARAQAEQTSRRFTFLAEAGATLNASHDFAKMLRKVTRLSIPQIADWCVIYTVAEIEQIDRPIVLHRDSDKIASLQQIYGRFLPHKDSNYATSKVMRTGLPEFYPQITDDFLARAARNEEHLALLQQVGFHSAIVVPIKIQDQVMGTITLALATAERRYDSEDLAMAIELAARVSTAVENARLYQQTKQLNVELEARVRQRTAQLEAANKELEAFAYSVSHDLRAPLRAMDGFSRILLEDFDDEMAAGAAFYLQRIRHNAQQMGELIDDLLNFSRLSRQALHKESVRPTDIVRTVAAQLQPEENGRDVTITIEDMPPCQADPKLLAQVFTNLLSNALKYMRDQDTPCVVVGAKEQDGNTVYYVQDNGIGFDPKYADKVFGVFQRLHRAEQYEGTGVGLAIVQRIIHRHGGKIWVEAAVDEGATFYFTLA